MSDSATIFTVGKDLLTSGACDACREPLKQGDRVFWLGHVATPWKAEDDEDKEWSGYTWHVGCDEGSLAADLAS
jgi:hypothetical protein